MALVKECPSCHYENPATEVLCQQCGIFIASEVPREGVGKASAVTSASMQETTQSQQSVLPSGQTGQMAEAGATVLISSRVRFFDMNGQLAFEAEDGEVIGREGSGAAYLASQKTVSRKHAILRQTQAGWQIEDCSSNGTYVNGNRINGQAFVNNDDMVQLSSMCRLRIEI